MGMVIRTDSGFPFGIPQQQKEQNPSPLFPKKTAALKTTAGKNPRIAALQRQKNRLLAYKQTLDNDDGAPDKQQIEDALKWVRELIAMIDRMIAMEQAAERKRITETARDAGDAKAMGDAGK